jgi:hypothetical protein
MDDQLSKRWHSGEEPFYRVVGDSAQQLAVGQESFLRLAYDWGPFRPDCAPYRFRLPIETRFDIEVTFTEPTP